MGQKELVDLKRWSFLQRHKTLLISIGLFSLAFVIRAVGLDVFSTVDEGTWLGRSLYFFDALVRGDLKDTLGLVGHPGVTTEWIGSVAILLNYVPHIALQQTGILVEGSLLWKGFQPTMELLVIARYQIVLLTALFVVAVYVVLRHTLNGKIALLSALLLIFDPFFVAMSRVFLTDTLHAIFAILSVLCLGLALGQNKWHLYALSGASAGLAFLSKSPAIFVLVPLNADRVRNSPLPPTTPSRQLEKSSRTAYYMRYLYGSLSFCRLAFDRLLSVNQGRILRKWAGRF